MGMLKSLKHAMTNRLVGMGVIVLLVCGGWHVSTVGAVHSQRTCCLWKVTTPQNTVYLLGSIHMLEEKHFPLRRPIYEALQRAKHVVFEVNPASLAQAESSLTMLKMGVFTNGETLSNQLSPNGFAVAKTQLQNRGYDIEQFNRFKPWFLALTITSVELQKLGFNPDIGVDNHLYDMAQKQGKGIHGLETFEDQMSIFNNMSPKTQELFVLQSLTELSLIESEINGLMRSWVQGNAKGLEVMLNSMKQFPAVFQALITNRNQKWMPQIQSFLGKRDNYLVVVGSLHLLGKGGLLEMLKQKGYAVDQL